MHNGSILAHSKLFDVANRVCPRHSVIPVTCIHKHSNVGLCDDPAVLDHAARRVTVIGCKYTLVASSETRGFASECSHAVIIMEILFDALVVLALPIHVKELRVFVSEGSKAAFYTA